MAVDASRVAAPVRVRVLAFARLRDLLGFGEREFELPAAATLDDVWAAATSGSADAAGLRDSTRLARNGVVGSGSSPVADGDEVAFLPPVGGG